MKKRSKRRRSRASQLKGDRLVGRCDTQLKQEVAHVLGLTGVDESKLVRLAIVHVLPALRTGELVVQNGKLVPVSSPAPVGPGVINIPGDLGQRVLCGELGMRGIGPANQQVAA